MRPMKIRFSCSKCCSTVAKCGFTFATTSSIPSMSRISCKYIIKRCVSNWARTARMHEGPVHIVGRRRQRTVELLGQRLSARRIDKSRRPAGNDAAYPLPLILRAGEYAPSPRRSYDREADAVVRGAAVSLDRSSVVDPSAPLDRPSPPSQLRSTARPTSAPTPRWGGRALLRELVAPGNRPRPGRPCRRGNRVPQGRFVTTSGGWVWCRGWGSNPHGPHGPRDFKSRVSTSSTTSASAAPRATDCNGMVPLRDR